MATRSLFALNQMNHPLSKAYLTTLYQSLINTQFSYVLLALSKCKYSAPSSINCTCFRTIDKQHSTVIHTIYILFYYLSNNQSNKFVNILFSPRHPQPGIGKTSVCGQKQITVCWHSSTSTFPVIQNGWADFVTASMYRFEFKFRAKLAFINKYLSCITCNFGKFPTIVPDTDNDNND